MSILDKISKPISSISPLNEVPQKKVSPVIVPIVKPTAQSTPAVISKPSVTTFISKPIAEVVKPEGLSYTAPAPKGSLAGLYDKYVPKPVKSVVSDIKEGLMGRGQEVDIAGNLKEDTGLIGFLRPFGLGKTDFARIEDRVNELEKSGVDKTRAYEIAQQYIHGDMSADPFSKVKLKEKQKKEIERLALSDTEKLALRKVGFFEGLDTALGALDVPFAGTIGKNVARQIARSTEEQVIKKLLMDEVPKLTELQADGFSKVFKTMNNEEEVKSALNKIKYQTQKASDVKTPEQATMELAPKAEQPESNPLLQEAKKYKSAEEFVNNQPYLYHASPAKNLESIRTGGLKTTIGDRPIYLSQGKSTGWAGKNEPIFRVPKAFVNGLKENNDALSTLSTKVGIPADKLDVSLDGGKMWEPLNGKFSKSQLTDIWKQANTSSQPKAPVYEGETDLTTKILKDLEGKTTVSKQYILDATNRGELKQVERDLIRGMVEKEGDTINVSDFAKKVKAELLPLKRVDEVSPRYESVSLPKELRGNVANYNENIYKSPIKTSAGQIHFGSGSAGNPEYAGKFYFGHTRIEDMADNKTRRVIEVQSDLYQKGNLEREAVPNERYAKDFIKDLPKKIQDEYAKLTKESASRANPLLKYIPERVARIKEIEQMAVNTRGQQVSKLQQYNDPTAHFRMVREEIKKAAQDGKTKLQFPTGETAMKIEGLRESTYFYNIKGNEIGEPLSIADIKIGKQVQGQGNDWIITDVLGDGKFKAVPKDVYGEYLYEVINIKDPELRAETARRNFVRSADADLAETFDISGKVDTNNPIYKFYEKDVAKYLKKYDGKPVTDDKGVTWIEVPIKKEYGEQAVEAFKETSIFGRGPKIDIENVPDLLKNIVPQDKIKYLFNQNLIKERGALGVYSDVLNSELKPVIELYETGGKTYVKTAFHEAYHYLETKVFDPEFVKQLNKDTLAKMTKEDHARYDESIYDTAEKRASEYRADEFAKEETSKSGYKSKIAKVLELIRNAVKKIIEYAKQIKAKLDKMVAESGGGERGSIKLPDDPEQRLVEATKDLPVQKMETGFKSIDEIMPSFEKENRELTELYAQEDSGVAREVSDITNLIDNKDKAKAHIDSLKMEIAISKEFILDNPARQLSKYANKRTGELPEVTGNPTSIFAQKGDDIVTQLGFNSSEEARAAYQKYIEDRERYLKTKKNINEVAKDFTEKKQILEAVTKKLRKEGMDRKRRIDSIQEFFNLTDAEMKQVTKGMPDYRLVTEERFNNILKGLEGKAFEAFQLSEARTKVEYTIFDKELIKVDNLLKALKLPEIKNMTRKQLLQLNELMRSFKQGDEFLGVRQLETVVNTDIAGVKTKREVLEDLAKRTGVPYSELMRINVRWFDQYLYDVALANRSPFHKIMVEDTSKAMASANVRYFEFKEKMNFLMARARASKARTFVDRLIPTDDMIFDWLDSDSATKLTLASKMTGDELTAARFIQDKYSQVRDYLVSKGQLDRYRTDYITHIERGFLEAMRDAVRPKYINGKRISTDTFISRTIKGVFQGMKEMFTEYKQQEAVFNIMNQKTGEVLPLEKFFRFSMKRTGNLTPTKNVSKAVLSYMQAFEKKVALDSIVPKIDIYAHSITPNGMTKRGLELDDSIKRFVKEWLNTKRGRVVDTRIVVPGGPVDWAIRSAIAFTRLLDLGINVPTGLASNIGEQVMTVINIGFQKTALGATRALTPQGRKIAQKYAGFVGERVIDKVRDTSKDIGDRFTETVFGLFSDASRRANIEHLLGSMTPQEFAKGEMSAERLGQLRLEIGKYRVIDGGESIIGKTALGKAFTQYKSWAVGTLYSSIHNINVLQKMLRSKQNPVSSKEFQELLRATLMLSFVALTTYGVYSRLRDKKDRSFLEQLAFKSMNDSLSMIGALNPSLWLGVPRITSFLADLSLSLANISMSLVTGERTKQDKEIKGMSKLKATLTPSVVRSIKSIPFEDLMPKKPDAKLQGIKLVPRKKTDLNLKKKNKLEGIKLVPKKNKPIQLQ